MKSDRLEHLFGADGPLASYLAGFRERPAQLQMALAIEAALDGGTLVVEAETGIGKTLAYLIPAVLSGQKVVVSTCTIALQEQILAQEIPFIKQHIDPELAVLCVKGRQNYLCRQRWKLLLEAKQEQSTEPAGIGAIAEWLLRTGTGDRAELPWLEDEAPLWREICSTAEKCLGSLCPDTPSCFVQQLRRRAAAARMLIVNHHLFFSDLALRRQGHAEVLPRYESVIFDEAHHLENIATQYFGMALSHFQLLDLAGDAERTAHALLPKRERLELVQRARALAKAADRFLHIFPPEKGRWPLAYIAEQEPRWLEVLDDLRQPLASLAASLGELAENDGLWGSLERRAQLHLAALTVIAEQVDPSLVFWLERRERTVQLIASPIDLADELRDSLYNRVRSAILASATLTVKGDFRYFRERLGLPAGTVGHVFRSPFDYASRTALYIPENDFPEPRAPAFLTRLADRMVEIVTASQGRALLLFTSIQAMHQTRLALAGRVPYPLLMQGTAPRNVLLNTFRSQTHSILLAVASFWEGVDVPGEALSCVVIDKLPFESPTDPVVVARIDKIKAEGGNPFIDFQVPRAIFSLRQGLGRLLRSDRDSGLLAILDSRLFTKRYGRLFLESLPPSPIIREMAAVQHLFARLDDREHVHFTR